MSAAPRVKFLFVGPQNSGKTSLITKYLELLEGGAADGSGGNAVKEGGDASSLPTVNPTIGTESSSKTIRNVELEGMPTGAAGETATTTTIPSARLFFLDTSGDIFNNAEDADAVANLEAVRASYQPIVAEAAGVNNANNQVSVVVIVVDVSSFSSSSSDSSSSALLRSQVEQWISEIRTVSNNTITPAASSSVQFALVGTKADLLIKNATGGGDADVLRNVLSTLETIASENGITGGVYLTSSSSSSASSSSAEMVVAPLMTMMDRLIKAQLVRKVTSLSSSTSTSTSAPATNAVGSTEVAAAANTNTNTNTSAASVATIKKKKTDTDDDDDDEEEEDTCTFTDEDPAKAERRRLKKEASRKQQRAEALKRRLPALIAVGAAAMAIAAYFLGRKQRK